MDLGSVQRPADGIPAIDPSIDTRFRALTALGLWADRTDRLGEADGHYRAAAVEADRLIDRAVVGGSGRDAANAVLIAPMAHTVAAHNLAALRNRAGATEEARAIAGRAVERLLALAESPATPPALRLNCIRHLRHALRSLSDLDRAQGGTGAIADPLVQRVSTTAAEVVRVSECLRRTGGANGTIRPA